MSGSLLSGGLSFIWRGSPHQFGNASDILTHIMPHGYTAPESLLFEPDPPPGTRRAAPAFNKLTPYVLTTSLVYIF